MGMLLFRLLRGPGLFAGLVDLSLGVVGPQKFLSFNGIALRFSCTLRFPYVGGYHLVFCCLTDNCGDSFIT